MTDDHGDAPERIVAVLYEALEPGVALNAVGHLALGLAGKVLGHRPDGAEALSYLDYVDGDGVAHDHISARSLVVLKARQGQLRGFRTALVDRGALFVDFLAEMTGDTYREQLARTARRSDEELTYYGVCTIGARDELRELTRKLSLWR